MRKNSSKALSNALPRRLTLCTHAKKPKYSGKVSDHWLKGERAPASRDGGTGHGGAARPAPDAKGHLFPCLLCRHPLVRDVGIELGGLYNTLAAGVIAPPQEAMPPVVHVAFPSSYPPGLLAGVSTPSTFDAQQPRRH